MTKKWRERLYVFLCSYMWFVILFFFLGSLWLLLIPGLGLAYFLLGGLLHV
ncbi:MAG: hypothetical protein ACOX3K_03865 [Bacilli bacterium]